MSKLERMNEWNALSKILFYLSTIFHVVLNYDYFLLSFFCSSKMDLIRQINATKTVCLEALVFLHLSNCSLLFFSMFFILFSMFMKAGQKRHLNANLQLKLSTHWLKERMNLCSLWLTTNDCKWCRHIHSIELQCGTFNASISSFSVSMCRFDCAQAKFKIKF